MKETILMVKVIPNSQKTEIVDWEGNNLKIRIAAAPDKGKANQELIRFLSAHFQVPKNQIEILQGETSRIKRIKIKF